jgi:short-subunit dehydrogenase
MNIDQHNIVITGASSGIGRALLQQLSVRQVQVVAVAKMGSLVY